MGKGKDERSDGVKYVRAVQGRSVVEGKGVMAKHR